MNSKILAELVVEVVRTGQLQELDAERSSQFHRELEGELSDTVEKMRADKRRAYEELKNYAVI